VLYGPGGEGAHADVEWASIADTITCTAVLTSTARRFCG
jgi:acetylornithine deacetylase